MATQKVQRPGSEPTKSDQAVSTKEQNTAAEPDYSSKPFTAWQTVVMTAKVMVGAGVFLLLLWLLEKARN